MTTTLDLSAELLLSAYAAGIFPMGSDSDPDALYWVDPPKRGVLPLEGLHVSKSLRKRIRRGGFEVKIDNDFAGTMRDCAARSETWIIDAILEAYIDLHNRGFAHSVEIWIEGERAGGLYGVSLGGGFFGESMFSRVTDASKIALVYLVARLRVGGYCLLDTQFTTDHLESLGATEIPRKSYKAALSEALGVAGAFHDLDEATTPEAILTLALAEAATG